MRNVYIVATSQLSVVKNNPLTVSQMGAEVLKDTGQGFTPTALFVGNMLSSRLHNQSQLAALVAEEAGLRGIEAFTIDGACASGGLALRAAVMAVQSGAHDEVAVVGVEKMSLPMDHYFHDDPYEVQTHALAGASNWEKEGVRGETFLSICGRLHEEYIRTYCPTNDVMAPFSIRAHENALRNPYAFLKKKINFDDYKNSRIISDVGPLRLYDASPICDGAAALIVVDEPTMWDYAARGAVAVRIAGSAVATDALAIEDRYDMLWMKAAELSAKKALKQAGIAPEDVDIIEPHDAYNITTMLSLEASGFATRGLGWLELPNKKIPTCTQGGLKARGHPVGATGVYQVVEAYNQLIGMGGENQVTGRPVNIAFCQNLGGSGATVVTHVLSR